MTRTIALVTHARRISDYRGSRSGALHWADAAVLAAVGLVVLLVSLPRLREFALRENEADARTLVARLGELCSRELSAPDASAQSASPASLSEMLARTPQLAARLEDAEWLEQGALLRRHGYLFELTVHESGAALVAWPWEHGRTGCRAFRWKTGAVEGHPNPAGAWSGLQARTADVLSADHWRPVAP